MNKSGFVLAPQGKLTGALEINREILESLKKLFPIEAIMPKSEFYYQVPVIGSVMNYCTLLERAREFETVIATSTAGLPFIKKTRLVEIFHGVDTAYCLSVRESLKNEGAFEKSVREKWQKHFKKYLTENLSEVESRLELSKFVEEICAREASSIIAVSPSVKNQLVRLFGINPKKIKVIINGIKDEWFKKKNNFAETPQIVFISRFSESSQLFLEKGYDRAFEIFKKTKYPKKAFIYFNQHQENEAEEIKRIAKIKTNTDIIANASRNQMLESHQPGQIFLSTARVEACQLTLLEAMASKMVAVTYSVGIAPTAIKNGVNGFIVNSIPEAIDVINNLSRHPELRKKIGLEAYQTAKKHFTFERMIKEYQDYFQSIF